MKIFLSWSGDISRDVATMLRTWLRSVLHATDPWMSKEDIPPGTIWFGVISENITESKYGILCVTKENRKAPWLLWEAGALYRGFKETRRVVPFLINLDKKDLDHPLSNFQVIEATDKQEVLRMLKSINDELPHPIPEDLLKKQVNLYWSELQTAIAEAIEAHPTTLDVESTCKYTFSQAAKKFMKEPGKQESTIARDEIALRLPRAYIDDLPLDQVNDEKLREFKSDRLAGTIATLVDGKTPNAAKPSTLNKELRTIGAVLNRAAHEWGWLTYAPRIKQVPIRGKRRPYILDWQEQAKVFQLLPHNEMVAALFSINTGMKKGIIRDLEWSWLKSIPEIDYPIFVVPPGYHGSKYGRTIILNSIANRIVEHQRDNHRKYVFTGKRGGQFWFGNAWRDAWRKAGLPAGEGYAKGVDNLRLTFEHRLKTAAVSQEDRDTLMWVSKALEAQVKNPPNYSHFLACVEKITARQDESIVNL